MGKGKNGAEPENRAGSVHVLLVEDKVSDIALIRKILSKDNHLSFQVTSVESLKEAITAVRSVDIDAVVLDLELPDSHGYETFSKLYQTSPDIPIVILSATGNDRVASEAIRSGAQDYLVKGTTDATLLPRVIRYAMQRQYAERALRSSAERFNALVSNIPGALYRARRLDDGVWRVEYVSGAIESISGYPASAFIDEKTRTLADIVVKEDRVRVEGVINRAMNGNSLYAADYRILHKDGRIRWVHEQGRITQNPGTNGRWMDSVISDITDRMIAEERLNYLAQHDSLTGLPNRLLFMERVEQVTSSASTNGKHMAIFFLGLDHFKRINDTWGHAMGDVLLKAVGDRLFENMGREAMVARISGDEFSIMKSGVADPKEVDHSAQEIMRIFKIPFHVGEYELHMNCSMGIGLYPDNGSGAEDLLKKASVAMFTVKKQGRNNYQFYSPAMKLKAPARMDLENKLHRAIDRNEFRLYYQPQVDLASGEITGAEALIRWLHPELGLVSPAEFVPLAEETGLIVPLGEWVLYAACMQNKAWQDAGYNPIRIAVNLSARQFQQADLTKLVARVLGQTGMDSKVLELELTESIVMQDLTRTIQTLGALHAMGLHISIDDFGTGYSSLSYLKRFPISTLKIDRSFVKDITSDVDAATIVRTIISMARSLKLEVIAEGVETETQLTFLRSEGCDKFQGFLFSQAVPSEEFTKMLIEGKRLPLWERETT